MTEEEEEGVALLLAALDAPLEATRRAAAYGLRHAVRRQGGAGLAVPALLVRLAGSFAVWDLPGQLNAFKRP